VSKKKKVKCNEVTLELSLKKSVKCMHWTLVEMLFFCCYEFKSQFSSFMLSYFSMNLVSYFKI